VEGDCATPPSCGALLGNCGSNPLSCCNAPTIEGATFNRYNNAAYPAKVGSVRLDRFEVTVGRFHAFVTAGRGTQTTAPKAGDGAHPKVAGSGWSAAYNSSLPADTAGLTSALTTCDSFTNATYATDQLSANKPINCVSWYEAMAFCIWDGARLPSVAELELATRGGLQQRPQPWGSDPLGTNYLFYCSTDPNACTTPVGGSIKDVGSEPLGFGRWNHLDLYGSMREYALDIYTPLPATCNDCVQLDTAAATTHAAVGGSWADGSSEFTSIFDVGPTTSTHTRTPAGGFRCARDL
jgi:formylglycine-generating enzyme required for sulfatase activity